MRIYEKFFALFLHTTRDFVGLCHIPSELTFLKIDIKFISDCLEDVLYLVYPLFVLCKIRYCFTVESSRTRIYGFGQMSAISKNYHVNRWSLFNSMFCSKRDCKRHLRRRKRRLM